MKITHNKVGQNINATDTQSEKASGAAKTGGANKSSSASESAAANATNSSAATKVELSPRVQDIKKIKELAKNAPDVDADKVAKFKQMIAEGKYKVDAKAVANKMVDEHLKSRATEE